MKKGTSKKIIDTIKKEKIKPKQKWHFAAKRALFWLALLLVVLMSALFFSLALLSFVDFDFELLRQLKLGRYFRLLMFSAPYLWIVMLALTIFLGYQVFRKTKKGYRYSVLFVAGVIFLVVSALGVGAHLGHINRKFDDAFAKGPGPFRGLAHPGEERFFGPEEGVVAGKIIEKNNLFFTIDTQKNGEWKILYDANTRVKKPEDVEVNKAVIVVGEKTADQEFKAHGIKPMRGPARHREEKMKEEGKVAPPHLEGRARKLRKMQ